jgi:hypothetical protein
MIDPLPPPASWRLDWRNYAGHHIGNGRPPCRHKRFKTEEAARLELARLSALPGADVCGFVSAVPCKSPPVVQFDFGFPPGGECRMTD